MSKKKASDRLLPLRVLAALEPVRPNRRVHPPHAHHRRHLPEPAHQPVREACGAVPGVTSCADGPGSQRQQHRLRHRRRLNRVGHYPLRGGGVEGALHPHRPRSRHRPRPRAVDDTTASRLRRRPRSARAPRRPVASHRRAAGRGHRHRCLGAVPENGRRPRHRKHPPDRHHRRRSSGPAGSPSARSCSTAGCTARGRRTHCSPSGSDPEDIRPHSAPRLTSSAKVAEQDLAAVREAAVTKRFWHSLKPSCCPRCDAQVQQVQWERELEGACSRSNSPIDSDHEDNAPASGSEEDLDPVDLAEEHVKVCTAEAERLVENQLGRRPIGGSPFATLCRNISMQADASRRFRCLSRLPAGRTEAMMKH